MRYFFLILMLSFLSVQCSIKDTSAHLAHAQTKSVVKFLKKNNNKTTVVAVIDTGFGIPGHIANAHLCKFGHKDFTQVQATAHLPGVVASVPIDNHGHGTHIAGLVDFYASKGPDSFCIVVLKYFDPKSPKENFLENTVQAIKYATRIHADVINYSGGGIEQSMVEQYAVKSYIDNGGKFFAAAGNEHSDLSKQPFYPALDDQRVVVVGSKNLEGHRAPTSNYGSQVSCWEVGDNVVMYDMLMSGTSQATAIATGKFVAHMPCDKK